MSFDWKRAFFSFLSFLVDSRTKIFDKKKSKERERRKDNQLTNRAIYTKRTHAHTSTGK